MSTHLRHDRRSLALHEEAVKVLRAQPKLAARALDVLTRWEAKGDVNTQPLWDAWRRIIEGCLWDLAVEDSERGQQLRQASPLGFVLSEPQRAEVSHRFKYSESLGREVAPDDGS